MIRLRIAWARWRRERWIVPRTAEEVRRFTRYVTWLHDAWLSIGGAAETSEPWYWEWVESTAHQRR